MPNSLLVLLHTNSKEFRKLIQKCPKDRKWFLWHLVTELKNYQFFLVKKDEEALGTICISPDSCVDIVILEKFRNQKIGSGIIMHIKNKVPAAKFKVNVLNKAGLSFFDFLLSQRILSSRAAQEKCYVYQ